MKSRIIPGIVILTLLLATGSSGLLGKAFVSAMHGKLRLILSKPAQPVKPNPITQRYWNGEKLRKVIVEAEEETKMRKFLHDPAVIKQLDYGSFKLFILEEDKGQDQREQENPPEFLSLSKVEIDTTRLDGNREELPSSLRQTRMADTLRGYRTPTAGLYIVQFIGPIQSDWLERIKDTGASIVGYVGQYAYVVSANETAADKLTLLFQNQDVVQFLGDYEPAYRLRPNLRKLIQALDHPGVSADKTVKVVIQVIDSKEATESIKKIKRVCSGPVSVDRLLNFHNVYATLPVSRLSEIARMDSVFAMEELQPITRHDEMHGLISAGERILPEAKKSNAGYIQFLSEKGFPIRIENNVVVFDGPLEDRVVVHVVDDCPALTTRTAMGADASPQTNLSAFQPLHPDIDPRRIAFEYNPAGMSFSQSGHGFLNAHIIAGAGTVQDNSGFFMGLGIAPFAKVGVTSIFNDDGEIYLSERNDFYGSWESKAYQLGARISNNSWGTVLKDFEISYSQAAQTYDALVADVDKNKPDAQPMIFVFSAGNFSDPDGDREPEGSTISSPGIAKNVITVGATEGVRKIEDTFCAFDKEADNLNQIAYFSGRGKSYSISDKNQCIGNQIQTIHRSKPDLVAPGTHIQGGAIPEQYKDRYLENLFNCPKYYPAGQPYTWSNGTSHAAPAVAGAAALLLYRFRYLNSDFDPAMTPAPMSPAMVKAYLMNSARHVSQAPANRCTGRNDFPSSTQGMGALDLNRAFDDMPRILIDQTKELNGSGDREEYMATVARNGDLRITLAWTDPPKMMSSKEILVNDLNLLVTVNGKDYIGNYFKGPYSNGDAPPKIGNTELRDRENNVESVYVNANAGDKLEIVVRARNMAKGPQRYALVVYNARPNNPADLKCVIPSGPAYAGSLDRLDDQVIGGWLADTNALKNRIAVDVFDGETKIASTIGDLYRPDVADSLSRFKCATPCLDGGCPDDGKHGFSIPTPAVLKDGRPHTVSVRVSGSNQNLDRSPMRILFPLAATAVSGASYRGPEIARDSIGALFGTKLANLTVQAATTPLPTTLGETVVSIRDSQGTERLAPLFFVSPQQVCFLIPPETSIGLATVTTTSGDKYISQAIINVMDLAPGLFSASANGQGLASAVVFRVKPNGEQSYEPAIAYDNVSKTYVPVPINVDPAKGQAYLILFGTGFRARGSLSGASVNIGGVTSPAFYAGPQGTYAGLDQVNVLLSPALSKRGKLDVALSVGQKTSNLVSISIE